MSQAVVFVASHDNCIIGPDHLFQSGSDVDGWLGDVNPGQSLLLAGTEQDGREEHYQGCCN